MTVSDHEEDGATLYSIGDVAEATGLSVDTIRVWERRYGRPRPVRLPSGHRRYTEEQIRWLRRIAEALSRGHRPSGVVPLPEQKLDQLLEPTGTVASDEWSERILDLARRFEGAPILEELSREAIRTGARTFVLDRLAPLSVAAGRAWADGRLRIRHEHYLTGLVDDVLRDLRRKTPESDDGPLVVLATMVGERHGLGIQMAALVAKVAGARVRLLGTDVPPEELIAAAAETGANAVAVGVSLFTGGPQTDRELASLRAALPAEVRLLIGGRGARGVRRGPRGVEYAADLAAFERWLAGLRSG